MMRAFKDILQKSLLVACSLLFVLILVELCVRGLGLYRFPSDSFIEPHPELGWSHIPKKEGCWTVGDQRIPVKINSKGLRDKEYPYKKGKGIFRILVLGDSFTEGFQVPLEDTFCKALEQRLNGKGERVEVINAGFAGVGTDYELLFFRCEGYKYDPNLVILAFFGNDIYDNYRSKDLLADKHEKIAYARQGTIAKVKQFLADNSCAYSYLGTALPKHAPFVAKLFMRLGLLSYQPIGDAGEVVHLHYLIFEQEYGPELEQAWNLTKLLISELKNDVECRGAQIAVVSIPFREQVYEEKYWKPAISRPGMKDRKWDLERPDKLLSDFLNRIGVPLLEFLPGFRKAGESAELYYTGADGHWNVNGHHLAGEVIYDWLVKEKLVPIEAVKAQS